MKSLTQLIQRSMAGDQVAFGEIFEQFKNLVYKTAYLMLDNPHEAEDALQEIFVKVYRSLDKYQPSKAAFSTWLYRITVNHCLNQRRKPLLAPVTLEQSRFASQPPHTLEDRFADEQAIQQALNRLSAKLRAVIVLRFYHDLAYAEIAQILEIPLGTVQSRLHQGMQQIKHALQAEQSRTYPKREVPDELP
ncbi:MAG: RNA polymerase sigma factor [Anaerolineales bacterium]